MQGGGRKGVGGEEEERERARLPQAGSHNTRRIQMGDFANRVNVQSARRHLPSALADVQLPRKMGAVFKLIGTQSVFPRFLLHLVWDGAVVFCRPYMRASVHAPCKNVQKQPTDLSLECMGSILSGAM